MLVKLSIWYWLVGGAQTHTNLPQTNTRIYCDGGLEEKAPPYQSTFFFLLLLIFCETWIN